MKVKTTAKSIREGWGKKIAVSYCGMQNLLFGREPFAYTCGVYGWNFDVYSAHGVTICTGYRGMVGKSVDYDILREYETAAERIRYSRDIGYEEKLSRIDDLLREFLEKVA